MHAAVAPITANYLPESVIYLAERISASFEDKVAKERFSEEVMLAGSKWADYSRINWQFLTWLLMDDNHGVIHASDDAVIREVVASTSRDLVSPMGRGEAVDRFIARRVAGIAGRVAKDEHTAHPQSGINAHVADVAAIAAFDALNHNVPRDDSKSADSLAALISPASSYRFMSIKLLELLHSAARGRM